jgi:hypothetical protein
MPNIVVISPDGEVLENPQDYLIENFGYGYASTLYKYNNRFGLNTINLGKIYNNSPQESKTVREQNFLNGNAALGNKSKKVNQISLSEFKKQNNLTDYDTVDINGVDYAGGYAKTNAINGSARDFCELV